MYIYMNIYNIIEPMQPGYTGPSPANYSLLPNRRTTCNQVAQSEMHIPAVNKSCHARYSKMCLSAIHK